MVQATPVQTSTTISYTIPASAMGDNKASMSASGAPAPGGTTFTSTTTPPPAVGQVHLGGLGRNSAHIRCPYCHVNALTRSKNVIECATIGIVILLLL
jgi:hypothetical protein